MGHRPNRVEPRAVKRRPKPHKLLTKPRAEARAELLAGVYNMVAIPSPPWFWAVGFVLFHPSAYLGAKVATIGRQAMPA